MENHTIFGEIVAVRCPYMICEHNKGKITQENRNVVPSVQKNILIKHILFVFAGKKICAQNY